MGLVEDAIDEVASNKYIRYVWYLLILGLGITAIAVSALYNYIVSSPLGSYLLNELGSLRNTVGFVNTTAYSYALLPEVIYLNNSRVDLINFVLLLTMVIPVVIIDVLNGGLVGFVSMYRLPALKNALVVFYLLSPHGVVEIPAFALVASSIVTIKYGVRRMYYIAFALLLMSLLMLFVAALVESTITPLAGGLVQSLTNVTG